MTWAALRFSLIHILLNGTLVDSTAVAEKCQGTETIICRVVAEALGVPLEPLKRMRVMANDALATASAGSTWVSLLWASAAILSCSLGLHSEESYDLIVAAISDSALTSSK